MSSQFLMSNQFLMSSQFLISNQFLMSSQFRQHAEVPRPKLLECLPPQAASSLPAAALGVSLILLCLRLPPSHHIAPSLHPCLHRAGPLAHLTLLQPPHLHPPFSPPRSCLPLHLPPLTTISPPTSSLPPFSFPPPTTLVGL